MLLRVKSDFPDVQLDGGVPLIDGITIFHGPRAGLAKFFLQADEDARRVGVSLRLHRTLDSLIYANQALESVWGAPMIPTLNPRYSALTPDNSFWISGHDSRGRVVATQAARVFDMSNTNVFEEMRSFRLLYDNPAPILAGGARFDIEDEAVHAASSVTGKVLYSGGAWYRPDFRGRGLSFILPRISRCLGYTRWQTNWTMSMVEPVLVKKMVHGRYGYTQHAPLITLRNSYRGDVRFHFIWMAAEQLLADLDAYTTSSAGRDILTTDEDDTNEAPATTHGSRSRS